MSPRERRRNKDLDGFVPSNLNVRPSKWRVGRSDGHPIARSSTATTSPTTISAGARSPAPAAAAARPPRGARTTRCRAVAPSCTTAAGVAEKYSLSATARPAPSH